MQEMVMVSGSPYDLGEGDTIGYIETGSSEGPGPSISRSFIPANNESAASFRVLVSISRNGDDQNSLSSAKVSINGVEVINHDETSGNQWSNTFGPFTGSTEWEDGTGCVVSIYNVSAGNFCGITVGCLILAGD